MVFYSSKADNDIDDILFGLLNWKKISLTKEHCRSYVSDIIKTCNKLDKISYHALCTFALHKRYGKYVHHYRRTKTTTWYIIYNRDKHNNIFIQRIISNHLTTEI